MTANSLATATLRLFVTSVRPPTVNRTGRARIHRRSERAALSQSSAIMNKGKTIPKTYARPRVSPPIAEPDSADSVITPTRTGAQQLDATPENTPSAKKLAPSPRLVSGEAMNDGRDHIRPDRLRAARVNIRSAPA